MKVGIPKEIKDNENRVGMTPAGVAEMVKHGHEVFVQHTAGEGSGFRDEQYQNVGATILGTIEEIYATADLIVKVKEPIAPEYPLVRKGQVLFTYFHFACEQELTEAMLKSGAVCIAYETVEKKDHSLPLLIPMSEVAGRMATQNGAYYLQKTQGGKGKLMAGVPGVKPAKVLVLGGGTVGEAAARTHLITKDMLKLMEPGTVLVDVAIDQGGCFETSHPTKHSDPVYTVDGIVHYAVANIPGAVPNTSTMALTNATLRYALALADKGWKKACLDDEALRKGVNIVDGKITYEAVAKVFGKEYTPLEL